MANQEFMIELSPLRRAICAAYRIDEKQCLEDLLIQAELPQDALTRIQDTARKLVIDVRKRRLGKGGLDAFLFEYDLSSEEGVALMCLAEALLRIPDNETIDKLIKDKITQPDWEQHLGKSKSTFVNAATWALMLTGKVISPQRASTHNLSSVLQRLTRRSGEPVIREAVSQAMKILGRQFVMGQTIDEALKRAVPMESKGFLYSYDMLGEEACTLDDADKYFASYMLAIETIGKASVGKNSYTGPGISVKLSALHPRYEWRHRNRVLRELLPRLLDLVLAAKKWDLGFTVDAEESDRLDLSLDLMERIIADPRLDGWNGFGLAVQAYQKRAPYIIDYIADLARKHKRRIMLRLVKGAYWDAEIKWAQERGMSGYPVFTRKAATDVSYIACVKKILAATDVIYPQFATHNAYTVALIIELAQGYRDFEFQCLHGMGDSLYSNVVGKEHFDLPCRIYAPVGGHQSLLAYLVRRLLENGANTSFVNRIVDERAPVEEIIAEPCNRIKILTHKPHPKIPLPENLYGDTRPNSHGLDFTNPLEYKAVLQAIVENNYNWLSYPTVGKDSSASATDIFDMTDGRKKIGSVIPATPAQVELALDTANKAAIDWGRTDPETRIRCLQRMAGLIEQNKAEFIALLVHEAGKTLNDAVAEIREAIDYCWYYSYRTSVDFQTQILVGPTGEHDQIKLHGRGVIACISPWNFPLAIFLGQVVAALLAGNTVLAKPASQTPLVAAKAMELLHLAGIPKEVVQLVPGSGSIVGEALICDQRVRGVIFTGSTDTAWRINKMLANRPGPIVPFIAETGGQNAMIADSSVLPEQIVKDVISSAFGSAGQRCSSLRVLYLQNDVADKIIKMLCGAMAELNIGDPLELSTDIGPVIDKKAYEMLMAHKNTMKREATLLYEVNTPVKLQHGNYFAPCAFEIKSIAQLTSEVFGPILHVIRYKASDLEQIIDDINHTGYGLTLGVHSRIDETVEFVVQRAKVGNVYVNRNMIGAVVGVQPFGGEGLSGTGPKAGGPLYLPRLATEHSLSINTSAAGGNATLMSLQE
jgi:RHH-type proline utilization regulon transcriptional repressor/proline dehydrogenase/delta 1-pyrroline-5-carboxylate dehydrogenase